MEKIASAPSRTLFWLLLLTTASLLTVVVVLSDLPIILIPAGIASIAILLLIPRPLALLSFLIILRMSLDISADTYSIPVGRNFSISLSQALGITVTVITSLSLLYHRKSWKSIPLRTAFMLILAWGFLSLSFSVDTTGTAREILRVLDLFLLFILAFVATKSRTDLKRLIIAFFLSSIIPIAVGIYQFAFHIGFQDESVSIPRIYGTFSHPNIFSLYLFSLIALAFLFFSTLARTPKEKSTAIILLAGYVVMLLLTYTRVSWVILFAFFFILALLRFRKLLTPIILLPLCLFIVIAPFQERLLDSIRFSPDSSISWRLSIWKDGISATIGNSRTLFGSGMNTFSTVSEHIRGLSQGPSNDPHNDFVKFFVEGGVIGLGIFILYLALIARGLLRQFNTSQNAESKTAFLILFAFFASLMLASLSDNIFKNTPVQWIFWITLGATLKAFASSKQSPTKEKPATPALQK